MKDKIQTIIIAKDDYPLELYEGNSILTKIINLIRKIKLSSHRECLVCYEKRKGIKFNRP